MIVPERAEILRLPRRLPGKPFLAGDAVGENRAGLVAERQIEPGPFHRIAQKDGQLRAMARNRFVRRIELLPGGETLRGLGRMHGAERKQKTQPRDSFRIQLRLPQRIQGEGGKIIERLLLLVVDQIGMDDIGTLPPPHRSARQWPARRRSYSSSSRVRTAASSSCFSR